MGRRLSYIINHKHNRSERSAITQYTRPRRTEHSPNRWYSPRHCSGPLAMLQCIRIPEVAGDYRKPRSQTSSDPPPVFDRASQEMEEEKACTRWSKAFQFLRFAGSLQLHDHSSFWSLAVAWLLMQFLIACSYSAVYMQKPCRVTKLYILHSQIYINEINLSALP